VLVLVVVAAVVVVENNVAVGCCDCYYFPPYRWWWLFRHGLAWMTQLMQRLRKVMWRDSGAAFVDYFHPDVEDSYSADFCLDDQQHLSLLWMEYYCCGAFDLVAAERRTANPSTLPRGWLLMIESQLLPSPAVVALHPHTAAAPPPKTPLSHSFCCCCSSPHWGSR